MNKTLQLFSEQLQKLLSPDLDNNMTNVARALVLYRQGRVRVNDENQEQRLYGKVQDITVEQVMLDLAFPSNSKCTCKEKNFCQHQLSVFFTVYGKYSSVSIWVEKWKSGKQQKINTYFDQSIHLAHDYFVWKEFLQEKAVVLVNSKSLVGTYGTIPTIAHFEKELKNVIKFETEWVRLFKVIGFFFALKEGWQTIESVHSSMRDEQLFQLFKAVVIQYSRSPIPFQIDSFHNNLVKETEDSLFLEPSFQLTKWQVYRLLWTQAFSTEKQRNEELQRLEKHLTQNNFIVLAKIHHFLLLKQWQQVIEQIAKLSTNSFSYILMILEELILIKQWEPATVIINWLIQKITTDYFDKTNISIKIQEFCRLVRICAEETNHKYLYEKALKISLPFSKKEYAQLLFEKKEYRKWIDLQKAYHTEIFHTNPLELKVLQKEDVALLLPIYHQQVHEKIHSKIRKSYQTAIHHLAFIKKIYSQQGETSEWDRYYQYIITKYKRLRAFQEELERGKLK